MPSTLFRTFSIEPPKMEDVWSQDCASNTGVLPPERRDEFFATAYPVLSPSMVWARRKNPELPFPFNHPSARYFYFARNAIHGLARHWNLAGKEVLFPSYFHGVELEALLAAGVHVRFYPVRHGMQVNWDEVASLIRGQTRVIYLIHYLGFPGPVRELSQLCRQRNLLLIEDCALALFSRHEERPLGSWGDAAIYCLYKSLPVPNGGAIVLRRGGLSAFRQLSPPPWRNSFSSAARSLDSYLSNHNKNWQRKLLKMTRNTAKKMSRSVDANSAQAGTNHFNPLHAELGMSRLSRRVIASQDFSAIVEKRRKNFSYLLERLRGLARPVFGELPQGVCPLSYPLLVEDKPAVVEKFLARGVEAVNMWFPNHPMGPEEPFPETDELRRTVLELPCHQDLSLADLDRLITVATEIL